jgi:hypothetical protein
MDFFHLPNPPSPDNTLGIIQPLKEINRRNFPGAVKFGQHVSPTT